MTIHVHLTDSDRRAEVIRTGRDPGTVLVLADLEALTPDDRALIVSRLDPQRDGSLSLPTDWHSEGWSSWRPTRVRPLDEMTVHGVAAAVRQQDAIDAREAAERDQRHAAEAARDAAQQAEREERGRERAAADLAARPPIAWLLSSAWGWHEAHPGMDRDAYAAVQGVAEREAAAYAIQTEHLAAIAEDRQRATEREQAERADWIEAHGSERLVLAARLGHECDAIYRDERLAHDLPGWVGSTEDLEVGDLRQGEPRDPRNPPLAALQAQQRACAEAGDPAAVALRYVPLWRHDPDHADADRDGDVRIGGIYVLSREHEPTGQTVYRLAE